VTIDRALQILRHEPEVPEYAQRPPSPAPPVLAYFSQEPAEEQTEPRQIAVDPVRAIQGAAYLPYGEAGTALVSSLRSARRHLLQIEPPDDLVRRWDRIVNDIMQLVERDALDQGERR
jgi:hypothetical protein